MKSPSTATRSHRSARASVRFSRAMATSKAGRGSFALAACASRRASSRVTGSCAVVSTAAERKRSAPRSCRKVAGRSSISKTRPGRPVSLTPDIVGGAASQVEGLPDLQRHAGPGTLESGADLPVVDREHIGRGIDQPPHDRLDVRQAVHIVALENHGGEKPDARVPVETAREEREIEVSLRDPHHVVVLDDRDGEVLARLDEEPSDVAVAASSVVTAEVEVGLEREGTG